ncbi:hypothetical protein PENSPDRAFT_595940 [Peniophora sp. CONT]|nr:hypothetical protein PENSPDRAFT_595940 [Peniophora sp. CONT]
MYLVRRCWAAPGTLQSFIVTLASVRGVVDLVPYFGPRADRRLDATNSQELPEFFHVNHFFFKDSSRTIFSKS